MSEVAELPWTWAGTLSYGAAVELLEARRQVLLGDADDPGTLFLVRHPAVVTLGRHTKPEHLLASAAELARRGVDLIASTRGGDASYHDLGQLMIYPVVRTGAVRRFVATLADAIVAIAAAAGVDGAAWQDEPAGVWIGGRKLAACGLHVHRGACVHGFALNVATAPEAWNVIVPCGLASAPVSLVELGADMDVDEVAALAGPILCRALGFAPRQQRWRDARAAVWSASGV